MVGVWALWSEGEAAVQQPGTQEAAGQVADPGGGEHPHQVHQ